MTDREPSGATDGTWPARRTAVLDWLVNGTRGERFLDNIFVAFCERLNGLGVPVTRAGLFVRTDRPQWLGGRLLWRPGMREAEILPIDYGVHDTDGYRRSPARMIQEGAAEIRRRLDGPGVADGEFPVVDELRRQGFTDYVAWPLHYTLGQRQLVTFATDHADGFSDGDLALLKDLLPVLAVVTEVRLKNRLARSYLDTYVGPHASEAILNGATRRGSGVTVEAAIVVIDLRGFTAISDLWPRDDVIALLNEYFDAVSEPIERHGGEILKFMGDGLLAIFPDDAAAATRAVADMVRAMKGLNADRAARGLEPLGYGVGVNFGDVMYGNIGSANRLDFTVIGPAVNVASRLESLTKELEPNVLFSGAFVAHTDCMTELRRLGAFPLRGIGQPLDVYAFAEEPA